MFQMSNRQVFPLLAQMAQTFPSPKFNCEVQKLPTFEKVNKKHKDKHNKQNTQDEVANVVLCATFPIKVKLQKARLSGEYDSWEEGDKAQTEDPVATQARN